MRKPTVLDSAWRASAPPCVACGRAAAECRAESDFHRLSFYEATRGLEGLFTATFVSHPRNNRVSALRALLPSFLQTHKSCAAAETAVTSSSFLSFTFSGRNGRAGGHPRRHSTRGTHTQSGMPQATQQPTASDPAPKARSPLKTSRARAKPHERGQKRSPGPRRRAGSRVQLQPQCHLSLVPCLRSRTSMNLNQRPSHSTRVRFRAATSPARCGGSLSCEGCQYHRIHTRWRDNRRDDGRTP